MIRLSSFLLLWLLFMDTVRDAHGQSYQQQQRRRQQEQRRRREQRQEQQTGNDDDGGYTKEELYEVLRQQNVTVTSLLNSSRPKHIVEALWNTMLYSGGLFVSGAITMIGTPITSIWMSYKHKNEMRALDYIAPLIGGSVAGGILGIGAWVTGTVYGLFQVVSGVVATPRALWAWIEGRVDYQNGDAVWRYYNLTQHADALASSSQSSGGGNVEDDSLYRLLGVETKSSAKDIKRAYYKLAKQYHPDKNPNEQDKFLKIHRAYETLYDENQRKAYDEWGSASSSEQNMFDPGIFFDVFFGVSPELESYIGDMAIKSFSKSIMKISLLMQQQASQEDFNLSSSQKEQQKKMFLDFFSNHSRDVREVDIALYLQEFTEGYVTSSMTEDMFRAKCQHEGIRLMESTPFSDEFLQTIGSVLYWEGGQRTVQTPFDLPMSIATWTRGHMKGMWKWTDYGIKLYNFYGLARESHAEANETIRGPERGGEREEPSEEDKRKFQEELLKKALPELIEFVWKMNIHDITHALKGACWKVLYSNTCPHKRRQAKALEILGQVLLSTANATPDDDSIAADEGDAGSASGFMDIQARLEVAFQMATMGGRSGGDKNGSAAEDMVRDRRTEREQEENRKSEAAKKQEERRRRRRTQTKDRAENVEL